MSYERKTVDIYISRELAEILKAIEGESLVAKLLLRPRHPREVLVDDYVNYISLSKQDKSKLSYLSKDRIDALDETEYWSSSKRYMAKPGSFISKLFKDIPAKEVEKFSTLLRSQSKKPPFTFNIVKGSDIKTYYYYQSYASSDRGTLGASCMKHDHCQRYLDLYIENQDNITMLVMLNDKDRLIGRALLWDFDGYKIMDRIYTQNDEELSFYFKQWATENGYFYKSEQNWFNTLFFEQVGTGKKEMKIEFTLPNIKQHYYPYMDTFKFIDLDKGKLYNYIPEDVDFSSFRTLTASDGGKHPGDYLVFDQIDRVMRYRNDAAWIQYGGYWTGRQNAVYSNYNDCYILNQDSVYNEYLDDHIFNEENDSRNNPKIKELIEQRKKERDAMMKKMGVKYKASDYFADWRPMDFDSPFDYRPQAVARPLRRTRVVEEIAPEVTQETPLESEVAAPTLENVTEVTERLVDEPAVNAIQGRNTRDLIRQYQEAMERADGFSRWLRPEGRWDDLVVRNEAEPQDPTPEAQIETQEDLPF